MYPRMMFHIGDVLSIVTGYDVSLRGEAGQHALEDYVAGRPLSQPERLIQFQTIARHVRSQFPALWTFNDEDIPPRELLVPWLERRAREHGEYLPVLPLHPALRPSPAGAIEVCAPRSQDRPRE